MPVALTVPNLYKYGFLTSRAVDFLSQRETPSISSEDREVLVACKDLIQKLIRGEEILIGPNPASVHNLRPDDVETFSYFLTNIPQLRDRAENAGELRDYFASVLAPLEAILADQPAQTERIEATRDFLSRVAEALLDTVKDNVRRIHHAEPMPPANE